jgi:hypothetical protein
MAEKPIVTVTMGRARILMAVGPRDTYRHVGPFLPARLSTVIVLCDNKG